MLQIRCKNNNKTKSFAEGTSLLDVYQEFADDLHLPYPVVSAKVNNVSQGLKFRVFQNRDVEFIDASVGSGRRVYARSLCFVLYKAVSDVFPGCKLFIEHPLSRGIYCNCKKKSSEVLSEGDVARVCQRMQEIIDADMPFRRTEAPLEEAVRVFSERGFYDKVKLLETSGQVYTYYYTLGDTIDYYYGPERCVPWREAAAAPHPAPQNSRTQRNTRTNQHVRGLEDRDSLRTNERLADASSTEELAGAGLSPTPRECLANTKLLSIGSISSQSSRSRKCACHPLWASKARRSNID